MQNQDTDKYMLILNSALQCFENFGYKATTVDQIAKVSKIGKGTFYNFFKTKEELFETIINQQIQLISQYSTKVVVSDKPNFEALNEYLYSALKCRSQQELFNKLTIEAEVYGTFVVIEGLKKIEQAAHDSLKKILEVYIKKGLIKPCDTTLIAFLMIELYTSLSSNWQKNHEALSETQIIEIYSTLFQSYLPD